MSRAAAVCVVTILLLAGCGGAADPTRTATPAPVPDAEGTASLPPGVGNDSVDASALAEAHRRAVQNRSYTLVVIERRRAGGPELGARYVGHRRVVRVDGAGRAVEERAALASRATFSSTVVELVAYVAGDRRFVRAETGNGTVHRVAPATRGRYPSLGAALVERYLSVENASIVAGAGDAVRIRGSGPTAVNGSYYTVEARVGPDGFVRELRANFRDAEGTARWVTVRYRHVGDTTVAEPDWVEDAAANATRTPTPRDDRGD